MRGSWWSLCLVAQLACQHAETTDTTRPARDEAPDSKQVTPAPKAAAKAPAIPAESGRIVEPGHPVLSVSAKGLRKEGGTEELKRALHAAGVLPDPSTATERDLEAAVTRFQAEKNLAKTGFADHETLRELGLDSSQVDLTQMPRTEPDAGSR